MNSAARKIDHHQSAKPVPIDVFLARCEARAHLVAHGLHSLHDSVDTLQEAAVAQGLVAQYGQDEIQWILSESFARWGR
jgi:NADH:ubiquinone oxidoreductase subunit B-like Fe-S oxidoreductase